jgi:hypothetical protein
VAWKNICKQKDKGGIGIKEPQVIDQALTTKIWWKWVKNPTIMWEKLWKKNIPLRSPRRRWYELKETV